MNHKMVCQSAVFPLIREEENIMADKWSVWEEDTIHCSQLPIDVKNEGH